jgi:hypothetical protein
MTEQTENIVQLAPYQEADKDKAIELFLQANDALSQNNVEMYLTFQLHALNLAKSIKRRQ